MCTAQVILYAAVDRGVKFSPQLLRNLRLVNKDFNRAGTRLLFRYFNATIGRGVSPTMPLYDLSKIVKAGHGHRIRKLIIGNLCPICTSSDEDVVDYVEGSGYYFPDIFQQLVGLQSLDINYSPEYLSQRALGTAFIDTILEAFESPPPRLKALSITYNDDSDQPVTPCLGHERMSRIMPQIGYLRINLSLTRTDGIMLLQYPDEYVSSACQFVNDGPLSAFEFVKYGENLRGVELRGSVRSGMCH